MIDIIETLFGYTPDSLYFTPSDLLCLLAMFLFLDFIVGMMQVFWDFGKGKRY